MSASVRTDDLNLRSPADGAELQHRIRQTARRLCDQMEIQYFVGNPDEYRCREAVAPISDQTDGAVRSNRTAPHAESP